MLVRPRCGTLNRSSSNPLITVDGGARGSASSTVSSVDHACMDSAFQRSLLLLKTSAVCKTQQSQHHHTVQQQSQHHHQRTGGRQAPSSQRTGEQSIEPQAQRTRHRNLLHYALTSPVHRPGCHAGWRDSDHRRRELGSMQDRPKHHNDQQGRGRV